MIHGDVAGELGCSCDECESVTPAESLMSEAVLSVSAEGIARASKWVQSYPSTTAALKALCEVLAGEFEDEEGERLLARFVVQFAKHEADQL